MWKGGLPMVRNLRSGLRKQDGFTLIELIVVVAILGILAAVLTPRVLDAVDNARNNAAMGSAKQVQLAMERYFVDENTYPGATTITDPGSLKTALDHYANIDAATMGDTVTYIAYAKEGDADADALTDADAKAKYYKMTIVFTNGDISLDITPSSVVTTP